VRAPGGPALPDGARVYAPFRSMVKKMLDGKRANERTDRKIIELVKSNPGIEEQAIAKELGISSDKVRERIENLRAAMKIDCVFDRRGNDKGRWILSEGIQRAN
jgi:predicted HTH transcriptional regulator